MGQLTCGLSTNFFNYFPFTSTGAVAILLLLAVSLLCAYELCAVYVSTGSHAAQRYSPSGFFFGVSAIALAINMLFICRMVFNGRDEMLLLLLLPFSLHVVALSSLRDITHRFAV